MNEMRWNQNKSQTLTIFFLALYGISDNVDHESKSIKY